MRRIVETYFRNLGHNRMDFIAEKFSTKQKQDIFNSLVSWLHGNSHQIYEDIEIQAPLEEMGTYLEIFQEIFVYTENKGHYDMMMKE